eukprot:TRINITY_DN1085_c2_g1_i1.p1 TRINITY_DN1085_c2_g1~~TRINITY_DN1085_c2_g1_i1.p1  ORF type:complete len:257 (+),score=42.60 TRINITY_DN1085_c2_g1_i1:47-817(+)
MMRTVHSLNLLRMKESSRDSEVRGVEGDDDDLFGMTNEARSSASSQTMAGFSPIRPEVSQFGKTTTSPRPAFKEPSSHTLNEEVLALLGEKQKYADALDEMNLRTCSYQTSGMSSAMSSMAPCYLDLPKGMAPKAQPSFHRLPSDESAQLRISPSFLETKHDYARYGSIILANGWTDMETDYGESSMGDDDISVTMVDIMEVPMPVYDFDDCDQSNLSCTVMSLGNKVCNPATESVASVCGSDSVSDDLSCTHFDL